MADSDKIALARKREELLGTAAKANQRQSEGRGRKGLAKVPNLLPINTRRLAAAVGVSGKLVRCSTP